MGLGTGLAACGPAFRQLRRALDGVSSARIARAHATLRDIPSLIHLAAHRSRKISSQAMRSLERLTGRKFASGGDWAEWWRRRGKAFLARDNAVHLASQRAREFAQKKDWASLYRMLNPRIRARVPVRSFASMCERKEHALRRALASAPASQLFSVEGGQVRLARLPWQIKAAPVHRHRSRKLSPLKALWNAVFCFVAAFGLLVALVCMLDFVAVIPLVVLLLGAYEGSSWFR